MAMKVARSSVKAFLEVLQLRVDQVRPLGKTVDLVDLNVDSVDLVSEGYQPSMQDYLYEGWFELAAEANSFVDHVKMMGVTTAVVLGP